MGTGSFAGLWKMIISGRISFRSYGIILKRVKGKEFLYTHSYPRYRIHYYISDPNCAPPTGYQKTLNWMSAPPPMPAYRAIDAKTMELHNDLG